MELRIGYGFAAAAYTFLAASIAAGEEIRCDRFDVQSRLSGDQLTISLDTDCPDFAEIMVSVSRTYYERGSDTAYVHAYFEEKSTVGKWRQPRQVSVAHTKWNSILETHREKMSRLGMGYTVSRVEDELKVRMVLPVNQKDERFGRRNENLVGNAVSTKGLRTAKSEVKIPYPLRDTSAGTAHLPSTDPYSLELKQSYHVAKETPLMPELQPTDAMAALKRVQYIPAGYVIEIVNSSNVHGNPWYQVVVRDKKGNRRGSGWVNSTALVGQELEPTQ